MCRSSNSRVSNVRACVGQCACAFSVFALVCCALTLSEGPWGVWVRSAPVKYKWSLFPASITTSSTTVVATAAPGIGQLDYSLPSSITTTTIPTNSRPIGQFNLSELIAAATACEACVVGTSAATCRDHGIVICPSVTGNLSDLASVKPETAKCLRIAGMLLRCISRFEGFDVKARSTCTEFHSYAQQPNASFLCLSHWGGLLPDQAISQRAVIAEELERGDQFCEDSLGEKPLPLPRPKRVALVYRGDAFRATSLDPESMQQYPKACQKNVSKTSASTFDVQRFVLESHMRYIIEPWESLGFTVEIFLLLGPCMWMTEEEEGEYKRNLIEWLDGGKKRVVLIQNQSSLLPMLPELKQQHFEAQYAKIYASLKMLMQYAREFGGFDFVVNLRYDLEFTHPFPQSLSPGPLDTSTWRGRFYHIDDWIFWFPWNFFHCLTETLRRCHSRESGCIGPFGYPMGISFNDNAYALFNCIDDHFSQLQIGRTYEWNSTCSEVGAVHRVAVLKQGVNSSVHRPNAWEAVPQEKWAELRGVYARWICVP